MGKNMQNGTHSIILFIQILIFMIVVTSEEAEREGNGTAKVY